MTVDEAARQAGPPEVRASIRSTRERLQRGEASVTDLVAATLAAIEAVDGTLGAYVAVDGDRALEEAAVLDRRIGQLGPAAWTRTCCRRSHPAERRWARWQVTWPTSSDSVATWPSSPGALTR